MSRIQQAFANGKAFIPFLTCGDPDLGTTAALVRTMAVSYKHLDVYKRQLWKRVKKSTMKQLRKSVREDIIMNGGCPA